MNCPRLIALVAAPLFAVAGVHAEDKGAVDLPGPATEATAAAAAADDAPPIGYRFARLSTPERKALRARFRLPMDALLTATSPRELRDAAVVQALPDPHRPLLPVANGSTSGGDPFADAGSDDSDPEATDPTEFNVLQKLFAADNAAAAAAEQDTGDDAFGSDIGGFEDDGFDPPAESAASDDSEDEAAVDDFDDPFADF